MQAIQLVSGVVKFPAGKVFDTQYGQRVNAVINLEDGTEAKLWGNPDDHELKQLRKGQPVQLVRDAKGYKLVGSSPVASPQPTAPSATSPSGMTDEQKQEIKQYIRFQAKIFAECLKQARLVCGVASPEGEPAFIESEESIRAIATTLYISAQKKFGL